MSVLEVHLRIRAIERILFGIHIKCTKGANQFSDDWGQVQGSPYTFRVFCFTFF